MRLCVRIAILVAIGSCWLCAQAQRVKVKPEVSGYEGQEVTMQCTFADANQDTKLTQNSWAKMSADGEKETVAVYNPQFGANYPLPSFQNRIKFRVQEKYPRDATLIISPLKIGDEGTYVCEFATYPHGNEEEEVKLDVLVKPTNDAKAVPVDAGESMVTVATCISANGKPASEITWRSELEGNYTNTEETGADGKITVTSWYKVVPTSKVNGMKIACEVRHKTTGSPETFPVHLSVQYPPEVRIQGYDDNWYRNRKDVQLTCEADANPPVTKYEWKLLDRTFPPSVTVGGVNEEVLHVEQVDDDLNATFICQATNALGIGDTKLKVFVRETAEETVNAGAIAGGIIGVVLLIVFLIVAFCIWKRRSGTQGCYDPKTRVFGAGKKAPVFVYRQESDTDKSNSAPSTVPLTHELPRGHEDMDPEDPKSEYLLEEEEEAVGPMPKLSFHHPEDYSYNDDDMESQRDGSIISKTPVYV
ncbi:PVR cell adhesion molecule related 2 like isoform X2 [Latimeria chalumnae]|uniref:PVR cell adhesion molecule related 2 like isoform X2 n=1 Tax=Latimeria chalumnae TaxID=7897 RepID=UPI0003C13683|nr:PREDICTED: nectin-1-like [Latimeria chalumnae]|eukprot:XP_005999183.1 PREDICTED: nectin-1-like [Latimeria chalumnae]